MKRNERRKRENGAADKLRAFVALEIDEGTRGRILEAMAGLRPRFPGLRWVSAAQLHLTLRFLGWSDPGALRELEAPLRRAAARCPGSSARVSRLGLFPDSGCARVLWLDVELPRPALELQAACEEAAVEAGLEPEGRRFRSHLTLGRWKEPVRRPELPRLDLGEARIGTLVLFRSELRPTGAVYTPLANFPLGQE